MEPKDMVKALRENMKLNRREFCDYFNIPYRTVQDWECGKRVMPEYVLRLLEYKIRMDQMLQEKNGRTETKDEKQKDVNENAFVIYNMCQQDYKEVYALWLSSDGICLNEIDDAESGIARFLLRNPNTCFLAKIAGRVVGAILAGNDGRNGYIYHLAVEAQYRGMGIATELVNHAVETLESLGIQKTAIVVSSENECGSRFWEKQGFTVREDLRYWNK